MTRCRSEIGSPFLFDFNLFLFRNNDDDLINGNHKRLRPGEVSPRLPVPEYIMKPPYVNFSKPPGIASGPEVHDEKGIECMRASGKLAAQVLEYAGTLVKVIFLLLEFIIEVKCYFIILLTS